MDLNMPEMGGIAATRTIKEEDPERVILALTVSEAEEDIVEMVAAGASGYVLKDVDPASLARGIQEAHAGHFQLDDALTRRGHHAAELENLRETTEASQNTDRTGRSFGWSLRGRGTRRLPTASG